MVTPDREVPRPAIRDRRGRGLRGPSITPHPAGSRHPIQRTPTQRFDSIAVGFMKELWRLWPEALGGVQLAVEEVPLLPPGWHGESVPLSTYVVARGDTPARLVLLRRPIEHRAEHDHDLRAMIHTVLIDQVADILGIDPDDVHPAYGTD